MKKINILVSIFIILLLFLISCSYDEPTGNIVYIKGDKGDTGASGNITATTATDLTGFIMGDGSNIYVEPDLEGFTLENSVAKGIWTNSGTWTLPALTLGGNVTINEQIFDADSGSVSIETIGAANGLNITSTQDGVAGAYIIGKQISASPAAGDILLGIIAQGKDSNGDVMTYAWEYFKIEDPNHGNIDSCFLWQTRAFNNPNIAMTLSSTGILAVDDNYDTFDEHDDAKLLKKGIKDGKKYLLEQAGVLKKKYKLDEDGNETTIQDGYMMNVQAFTYLNSGGVYQNREKIDAQELRIIELEQRITELEARLK